VDKAELLISRAEVAYKSGNTKGAVRYAKRALGETGDSAKAVALRIFIARALGKIGKIGESNAIYRQLLRENIYMPPVVMGLFYNNFKTTPTDKMRLNMKFIRVLTKC